MIRKKFIMFDAVNYVGSNPGVVLNNLKDICKWICVALEECKIKYNAGSSGGVYQIRDLPDLIIGSPIEYSPYQAQKQTVAFVSKTGLDSWMMLHNKSITDFDSVYGAQQLTELTPYKNQINDPCAVLCGVNYYRISGVLQFLTFCAGLKSDAKLDSPTVRSELKSEIVSLMQHEISYDRWCTETRNRNHVWKSKYSELISDNSQIVTFIPDC